MTFPTAFARALAPVAVVAGRRAGARPQSTSPTWPRSSAHLPSVQSMTANFTQTDARGPVARRARCSSSGRARSASNMAAATCCWSPTARR